MVILVGGVRVRAGVWTQDGVEFCDHKEFLQLGPNFIQNYRLAFCVGLLHRERYKSDLSSNESLVLERTFFFK